MEKWNAGYAAYLKKQKNAQGGKQAASADLSKYGTWSAWDKQYYNYMRSQPTSENYYPFATGKSNLPQADFFGVDRFDQDWIIKNSGLLQHLQRNQYTGNVLAPNKSSTPEQIAAYNFYQVQQAEPRTQKLESQWKALQEEIAEYVSYDMSAEDILGAIDWGKYKDLQEYESEVKLRNTPLLTRPVSFSTDALYGVINAAKNGQKVGDPAYDYFLEAWQYQQGLIQEQARQDRMAQLPSQPMSVLKNLDGLKNDITKKPVGNPPPPVWETQHFPRYAQNWQQAAGENLNNAILEQKFEDAKAKYSGGRVVSESAPTLDTNDEIGAYAQYNIAMSNASDVYDLNFVFREAAGRYPALYGLSENEIIPSATADRTDAGSMWYVYNEKLKKLGFYQPTEYDKFMALSKEPDFSSTLEKGGGLAADKFLAAFRPHGKDAQFIRDTEGMSEEEKNVADYLLAKGRTEEYNKFIELMRPTVQYRTSGNIAQYSKGVASSMPVLSTLASAGFNLLGTAATLGESAYSALSGNKYDKSVDVFSDVTQTIRDTVSENMSGVGKFLYEGATTTLDMLAASGFAGAKGAAWVMGSGAGAGTVRSALDRGGNIAQALVEGSISAAIEVFTESLTFGRLTDLIGGKYKGRLLKALLFNPLKEAAEELPGNIVDPIVDALVMGDKAELKLQHDALVKGGMSETEATKKVLGDYLMATAYESLLAAFSAEIMSAPAYAIGSNQAKTTKADLQKSNPWLGDKTAGDIAAQMHGLDEYDPETYQRAVEQKNQYDAAEAARTRTVADAMDSAMPPVEESAPIEPQAPAEAPARPVEAPHAQVAQEAMQTDETATQAQEGPENPFIAKASTADGDVTLGGVETTGDAATVLTESGSVPLADVQFANPSTEMLYKKAASFGSKYEANTFMGMYPESGAGVPTYIRAYDKYYEAGLTGLGKEASAFFTEGSLESKLISDEAKQAAYAMGQMRHVELSKNAWGSFPVQAQENYAGVVKAYTGKVTDAQKIEINMIHAYAKSKGVKITIVDRIRGANGLIDDAGNVYVSKAAVNGGMTYAATHEMTHYALQNNKEALDYLAGIVQKAVGSEQFNKSVEESIALHKRYGLNISKAKAVEEVVAKSMPNVVLTKENAERMANENPNLFQRILDWLRDFIKKWDETFKGTKEYEALKQNRDLYQEALDVFEAALESKRQGIGVETQATMEQAQEIVDALPNQPMFSLKNPIERSGDLIAVHNLSERKLNKMLDLGGFPGISIAIIDAAKRDFSQWYGECSVVFRSDTINPEKNADNLVYPNDALTPRLPAQMMDSEGVIKDGVTLDEIITAMKKDYGASEKPLGTMNEVRKTAKEAFKPSPVMDAVRGMLDNSKKKIADKAFVRLEKAISTVAKDAIRKVYGDTLSDTAHAALLKKYTDDLSMAATNYRSSAKEHAIRQASQIEGVDVASKAVKEMWDAALGKNEAEKRVRKIGQMARNILPADKKRVPYLEAKAMRAVPMTEAVAFIVPDNATALTNRLKEAGYDVYPYEDGKQDQRKAILNGKELDGVRFSLKSPIEETKDLIAVHNLNETKIRGAFELGGFPMPSIAVTKTSVGFDEFGDISLVFDKESINPADRRNEIYSSDAYTPTFPKVGHKINETKLRNVRGRINGLIAGTDYAQMFHLPLDPDNAKDYIERSDGDVVEAFKRNTALKLAYLKETGSDYKPQSSTKALSGRFDNEIIVKLAEKYGDIAKRLRQAGYEEVMKMEPQFREVANEFYDKFLIENGARIGAQVFPEPLGFSQMDELLGGISTYLRNGLTQETDYSKTNKDLGYLEKDRDYLDWIRDIFGNVVERKGIRNNADYFTNSGNPRSFDALYYEYTVDNAVRSMAKEAKQGSTAWAGFGAFTGATATKYSSISAVKADASRIQSFTEEEKEATKQGYQDRMGDIISKMMTSYKGDNRFIGIDHASEAIIEAYMKGKTPSGILRILKEWQGFTANEEIANEIFALGKELARRPVDYFEAKPRRAVYFNEIKAALIPNNTSKDVKDGLATRGVKTIEYDPAIEGERKRILNSDALSGVRFSLQTDSEGNELTPAQVEFFKDSKVRDENGALRVAYHGSPVKGITAFDLSKSGQNTGARDTKGAIFFTSSKTLAESYQEQSEEYTPEGDEVNAMLKKYESKYRNMSFRERYEAGKTDPEYAQYSRLLSALYDDKNRLNPRYTKPVFSGEVYPVHLNILDPYIVNADGQAYGEGKMLQWIKTARDNGNDGVIVKKFVDPGYETTSTMRPADMYVVFAPNQIKSITNPSPTASPDIRFMLQDTAPSDADALLAQNKKLQETVALLKAQFQLTKGHKLNIGKVNELAGRILKENFSKYSRETLADNLNKVFEYIANAEGLDWNDIIVATSDIAKAVLLESQQVNDDLYRESADLRKRLRTTPISLTTTQIAEVKSQFESVGNFRKRTFGSLRISNEGTPLDVIWQELSEQYPEWFPADTNEGDMPFVLMDVLNALKLTVENPFGMNLDEASADLALRIYDAYFDIPEVKTFADKKAAELQAVKVHYRNKIAELRQEYKEKADARVQAVKDRFAARDEKKAETATRRKYIEQIKGMAKSLSERLLANTDKSNVPEGMKKAVLDVLSLLDFDTPKKGEAARAKLQALREQYAMLQGEGRYVDTALAGFYDQDTYDMIDYLTETAGNKRLVDLSTDDLAVVRDVVRVIRHMVNNENKLFVQGRAQTVSDAAEWTIADLNTMRQRKEWAGFLRHAQEAMQQGLLTPTQFFKQFEGTPFHELSVSLRDGLDKHIMNVKQAEQYMRDAIGKYNYRKWDGDKAKAVKMRSGKVLEMTPDQMLTVYALWKRDQIIGTNHLSTGGIILDKGKVRTPTVLSQADFDTISGLLTEEQKAYADKMVEFLSTVGAEWGNETSMQLNNIKKYTEKYYFPFNVSGDYTRSSPGDFQDIRISNRGFTKKIQKGAVKPVVIRPFTMAWSEHVEQMSMYNALAVPLADITRVWNYTSKEDAGTSVKNAITRVFTQNANKYISTLLRDMNGGAISPAGTGFFDWLVGKSKRVAVAGNLSVYIQQMSAGPRATALIDNKYFIPGTIKGTVAARKSWNEMKQYVPTAQLKEWGYFDTSMTRTMYERAVGKPMQKIEDAFSAPAQWGDMLNWAQIWEAAKQETKATGLKGEEMLQAAARRVRDVLDQTQVVDSVWHRSEWYRSKGPIKIALAFMSEPIKMYNMLFDATRDFSAGNKRDGIRKVSAVAKSMVLNVVMRSLIVALRDRKNEKKDEEGKIVGVRTFWDKYVDAIGTGLWQAPFGLLPYIADIPSILQGFDPSRLDASLLEKLVSGGKAIFNDNLSLGDKLLKIADPISAFTGIPISNVYRDMNAIYQTAYEAANRDILRGAAYDVTLPMEQRLAAAVFNEPMDKNSGLYYDLLMYAKMYGTQTEFDMVKAEMIHQGRTEKGIQSELRERIRVVEPLVREGQGYLRDNDVRAYTRVVDALIAQGYERDDAIRMVKSEMAYVDNKVKEISAAEDPSELYKAMAERGYTKAYLDSLPVPEASAEGESRVTMFTYDNLAASILAGNQADIKTITDQFRRDGVADKDIRAQVTRTVKPTYYAMWLKNDNDGLVRLRKTLMQNFSYTLDNFKAWPGSVAMDDLWAAIDKGDAELARATKAVAYRAAGADKVRDALIAKYKPEYKRLFLYKPEEAKALKAVLVVLGYGESLIDAWAKMP